VGKAARLRGVPTRNGSARSADRRGHGARHRCDNR